MLRRDCKEAPKMILCEFCNSYLLPQSKTVLLDADLQQLLMEPGIDWGQQGDTWVTVQQLDPGQCTQEYGMITISAERGIRLRRCKAKDNVWKTQSVLFQKDKGWTNDSIRTWLKDNKYITGEGWAFDLPVNLRKLLGNSREIFLEWREFYLAALDEGVPLPRLVAWKRFHRKYLRGKDGQWKLQRSYRR